MNTQVELDKVVPGVVPIRTFCEASDEEVALALSAAQSDKAGGRKKRSLQQAVDELDKLLRDPGFDPFLVSGRVMALMQRGLRIA
jgi:hypothetical protein